jgi:ATP-binding cassette subfamily F protein 3
MVQLQHVSFSYSSPVLSDVTIDIAANEKVAIVGPNGAGKSTILELIAGLLKPDTGSVTRPEGLRIGYCRQKLEQPPDTTIIDYLQLVTGVAAGQEEFNIAGAGLAEGTIDLDTFAAVQDRFEHIGGYDLEQRAQVVLHGLGMEELTLDRPIGSMSGGQKTKLALAGVLLLGTDLLLLDEPTNNLDLPSVIWLEEYLTRISTTVVIVSHDRRFLGHIITSVIALDPIRHRASQYRGNFSEYELKAEQSRERAAHNFLEQQKDIAALRDRMDRMRSSAISRASGGRAQASSGTSKKSKSDRASGRLARQARNIEKQLDAMDPLEKPYQRKPIHFKFADHARSGDIAIAVRDVVVRYEDFVLGPVSFDLDSGGRAALLGGVGAGKSTLLKVITKQLAPQEGQVHINSKWGSYEQEVIYTHGDMSSVDFVRSEAGLDVTEACRLLKSLGIREHELTKRFDEFSPGGRGRIRIAVLIARQPEVLILDEPTNYMDSEAVRALEEGLRLFRGTLLIASHDRQFVQNIGLELLFALEHGSFTPIESIETYEASVHLLRPVRLPHLIRQQM